MDSENKCKHVGDCPLFAVFRVKSFMAIWQINYCLGNWKDCERYKRTQRGEASPVNLLPNGELLRAGPRGR